VLIGLTSVLGACAPRHQPPALLDAGSRMERYAHALAARDRAGVLVESEATIWATTERTGSLPGLQAMVALARPEAFRVRVESLFGVALDLAARGDSVTAYVPSRREGTLLDARHDSLGIEHPGRLGYRVWSGAWEPPADAWSAPSWDEESLLVVRWMEAGDSVTLHIGGAGVPRRIRVQRAGRGSLSAEYESWSLVQGVLWPALVEFADGPRTVVVTCRFNRVRFQSAPNPDRLAVRIPASAKRLSWAELRQRFERLFGAG
jgi:hypothetical protein